MQWVGEMTRAEASFAEELPTPLRLSFFLEGTEVDVRLGLGG